MRDPYTGSLPAKVQGLCTDASSSNTYIIIPPHLYVTY